ncbi:MAG: DNA-binding protein [Burkholderiaceae bacterium]|nr:MAG: DNA-binding protein [Burkholderiaceae bacterium]TBR76856.1 MAG: DNA-binding protein [Burkholderiaceae bacterium]
MGRIGVSQEQIDATADALLLEQKRPTVDRIRAHLGTGSPNTIGPMLDNWFRSLGARVADIAPPDPAGPVDPSAPERPRPVDGTPLAVRQAVRSIWDASLLEARQAAQKELHDEIARVAGLQKALEDEQMALEASRSALLENARQSTIRAEQLAEQLRTAQERLGRAEAVAAEQQERGEQLRTQLEEQRRSSHEQALAQAQEFTRERAVADERHAANERRHLQEIDRARQETARVQQDLQAAVSSLKESGQKLEAVTLEAASVKTALLEKQTELASHLHDQEKEIVALKLEVESVKADLSRAQDSDDAARKAAASSEGRLARLHESLIAGTRREERMATELESLQDRLTKMESQMAKGGKSGR